MKAVKPPVAGMSSGSEGELEAIASDWIARRDRGMSASETAALADWLQASPAHARAFARCEAAWCALATLSRLAPETLAELATGKGPMLQVRPIFRLVGALAAAAAGALGLYLRAPLPLSADGPAGTVRHFSSDTEAEARFVLPDGTIAELHRDSEVAVGISAAARRVRLLRGEAHFTVGKDSRQPFIVHAGNVVVRDLGTAFGVRLEAGHVAVLVTQGRVRVAALTVTAQLEDRTPDTRADGWVQDDAPAETMAGTELAAGQRIVIPSAPSPTAPVVASVSAVEIEQLLAWKERRLIFARTPLADAVAQINRHNRRQLVVADPATAALLVAGSVQADNLDAVLRLLAAGFGVTAEPRGDNEIVLRWGAGSPNHGFAP